MNPTKRPNGRHSLLALTAAFSLLLAQSALASPAKDDHTEAALKRATQRDLKPIKPTAKATPKPSLTSPEEELEKIKASVGKKWDEKSKDTDETAQTAEAGNPIITPPKVTSEPAPGTTKTEDKDDDKEESHEVKAEVKAPVAKTSHGKAAPAKEAASQKASHESKAEAPAAAKADDHASDKTAAAAHDETPSVPAETSLRWLTNGNTRFVKKHFRADGRSAKDRERLVAGQHPHAIVLSCADSRVPPEIVFDQALGEIFTIRVAGEALDSSVIASVEYAVEHLGPKLLVVMGHTKCGAVDTALKVKDGDTAGSEALDKLLADIRPHLKTVMTEKRSPNLEVESTLNADGVARDIVTRSEIIRKKVEAGELLIKPALYRMDSGKVTFY